MPIEERPQEGMKLGRVMRTAWWESGEGVDPSGCCLFIFNTSRLDEARGPGTHSLEKMCPRYPRGCDHSF